MEKNKKSKKALYIGLGIFGAFMLLTIIGAIGQKVAPIEKKTVTTTVKTENKTESNSAAESKQETEKAQPTQKQTSTVKKLSASDREMYIRYCTEEGIDRGACVCRVNAFDIILAKEPDARYMYLTPEQEKTFDNLMYGCDPQTGNIQL